MEFPGYTPHCFHIAKQAGKEQARVTEPGGGGGGGLQGCTKLCLCTCMTVHLSCYIDQETPPDFPVFFIRAPEEVHFIGDQDLVLGCSKTTANDSVGIR